MKRVATVLVKAASAVFFIATFALLFVTLGYT